VCLIFPDKGRHENAESAAQGALRAALAADPASMRNQAMALDLTSHSLHRS